MTEPLDSVVDRSADEQAQNPADQNGESQRGTSGGPRAYKNFTSKGRQEVKDANANANEGKVLCENCGVETIPGGRSQRGVSPSPNEAQVDHIIPKSKGGDGSPSNGQVLCRQCNRDKWDK